MNKKTYIEANDEIKASNDLKRKTLKAASDLNTNKRFGSRKIIFKLAGSIAIFLLVFSIAFFNKENEIIPKINNKEILKINLPTVDTYDKLYDLLSVKMDDTRFGILEDTVSESATVAKSQGVKQENSENAISDSDYSKTNIQVEGVDEADIVKTDGKNIYYLSDKKLVIVDATKPEDLKIKEKIDFDDLFIPVELYVTDSKVIVIGNKHINNSYKVTSNRNLFKYNMTSILVYDKNANFEKIREVSQEGYYNSSRMIGDNIYVVSNETKTLYNVKKEEINEEDFKPVYLDTAVSEEYQKINYDRIYYFENDETRSFMTIGSFNVKEKEEVNIETFIGAGNTIYASENNLYVVRTLWSYGNSIFGGTSTTTTQIYKFKLNGSKIEYVADTEINGRVLNQFSMDEYKGYFRVVTTEYDNYNETSNSIYILNEKLEKVSKIANLAEEERVYSVRFMGARAYVVTYKETDPLFVVDLSDVKSPKILGELKIPGYSEYLHPYDENHIIGFGRDTETVKTSYSSYEKALGMKMALFDVTDPTNPKELYNVKIGDSGTYSELLDNHKALLFSKEKNIIAFPISIRKYSSSYYYKNTFQGAIVFSLDLEKGFKEEARISHLEEKDDNYSYTSYMNSDNAVQRIIYIKDTLFTLSQDTIKALDLKTYKEVGSIDLDTGYDVIVY